MEKRRYKVTPCEICSWCSGLWRVDLGLASFFIRYDGKRNGSRRKTSAICEWCRSKYTESKICQIYSHLGIFTFVELNCVNSRVILYFSQDVSVEQKIRKTVSRTNCYFIKLLKRAYIFKFIKLSKNQVHYFFLSLSFLLRMYSFNKKNKFKQTENN